MLKIIFWNVKGLGNPETRLVLKNLCKMHRPDFLFLSEPWIAYSQVPSGFFRSLNLKLFVENDRGSIPSNFWCFCSDAFTPKVITSARQNVAFSIMLDGTELFFCCLCFYKLYY